MTELDKIAGQVALLHAQVRLLTERVASPAALPEWFRRLALEVHAVEQAALAAGVEPECAWCACANRRLIIRELRNQGWSLSRVARVLHMSETGVGKALKS